MTSYKQVGIYNADLPVEDTRFTWLYSSFPNFTFQNASGHSE